LLQAALARFPEVGLKILETSSWWRSAAWPDPNGREYRNGVALVEAKAGPAGVLAALLKLEAELGRERWARNAPRTLDLDLIAYGRQARNEPGLVVPHPRAHERLFVMGPLAEIAPGWRHPVTDETAAALAARASVGRDAHPDPSI
jgi:2-amino-4-hydroxy-6-hydroxymethyldihydropteridine diphosphokinase